jgi:membrane fusion protein (multidrug efflux system)
MWFPIIENSAASPRNQHIYRLAGFPAPIIERQGPTMTNPLNRTLLAFCLAQAATAAAFAQGGPPGPAGPVEVSVATLHAKAVSLHMELPGRISAYRSADVRPQIAGVILKRLFTEGDVVKVGQQLYQIDPAPYQASLASAKATLAHAKAATAAAKLTVDRYKILAEQHAVSQQDLDNAVSTYDQSAADIASAEASVKTAEINLSFTKMLSPITGRTGRSSVTEGALVTADQTTALVTITQLDPIYVDITQPNTLSLRLKRDYAEGRIKSAGDNQAQVSLTLEDGSAYDQRGRLQFKEVSVDQGTGSVVMRAIFPNDKGLLLPGMFVRAVLEEGVAETALLVPQQGVTFNQRGEPTALLVGADGKVEQRVLTTDRAIGNDWLVTKGVKDGDKVIVEGVQKVRPGAVVTIKEAANQSGSANPDTAR